MAAAADLIIPMDWRKLADTGRQYESFVFDESHDWKDILKRGRTSVICDRPDIRVPEQQRNLFVVGDELSKANFEVSDDWQKPDATSQFKRYCWSVFQLVSNGITFVEVELDERGPHGCGVELYGAWKDKVPANADIDKLLGDIRWEWTQNLEAVNE